MPLFEDKTTKARRTLIRTRAQTRNIGASFNSEDQLDKPPKVGEASIGASAKKRFAEDTVRLKRSKFTIDFQRRKAHSPSPKRASNYRIEEIKSREEVKRSFTPFTRAPDLPEEEKIPREESKGPRSRDDKREDKRDSSL